MSARKTLQTIALCILVALASIIKLIIVGRIILTNKQKPINKPKVCGYLLFYYSSKSYVAHSAKYQLKLNCKVAAPKQAIKNNINPNGPLANCKNLQQSMKVIFPLFFSSAWIKSFYLTLLSEALTYKSARSFSLFDVLFSVSALNSGLSNFLLFFYLLYSLNIASISRPCS